MLISSIFFWNRVFKSSCCVILESGVVMLPFRLLEGFLHWCLPISSFKFSQECLGVLVQSMLWLLWVNLLSAGTGTVPLRVDSLNAGDPIGHVVWKVVLSTGKGLLEVEGPHRQMVELAGEERVVWSQEAPAAGTGDALHSPLAGQVHTHPSGWVVSVQEQEVFLGQRSHRQYGRLGGVSDVRNKEAPETGAEGAQSCFHFFWTYS